MLKQASAIVESHIACGNLIRTAFALSISSTAGIHMDLTPLLRSLLPSQNRLGFSPLDFVLLALAALMVLSFLGMTDVHFVYAEGLAMGPDAERTAIDSAYEEIEAAVAA